MAGVGLSAGGLAAPGTAGSPSPVPRGTRRYASPGVLPSKTRRAAALPESLPGSSALAASGRGTSVSRRPACRISRSRVRFNGTVGYQNCLNTCRRMSARAIERKHGAWRRAFVKQRHRTGRSATMVRMSPVSGSSPGPAGHAADNDYDSFAEAYSAVNEVRLLNAYYERPAALALAGDVAGRRVLDAGCGSGPLFAALRDRGAIVTGFDKSAGMLELARRRFGDDADLRQADLGRPLPFPDGAFDDVIASLVLRYLEDWTAPLAELRRVLRPGGRLIASVDHPMAGHPLLRPGADYFATFQYPTETTTFSGQNGYRLVGLSQWLQSLFSSGSYLATPNPVWTWPSRHAYGMYLRRQRACRIYRRRRSGWFACAACDHGVFCLSIPR